MMYNDIKYFHYTRRRIIKYLMSLYIILYNDIKYFIILHLVDENICFCYTMRCIMKYLMSLHLPV